jgi:tRNA dimethylallyltransferase
MAVVIMGPTASGKSEIAARLARRFGGWILSVDSMAVYRGLDIGTSKPSPEIRREIPHRGLDLAEPDEDYSVGDFLREADRALGEMRAAGALPILVGGSGLYLRAVLKGVSELPRRDPALRGRLRELEADGGTQALHRLLERQDPASARRIAPADRQRVVRALELAASGVTDAVGKPRAEWLGPDRFVNLKIGLRRGREELARRIRERADGFLRAGLLEETRALLARPGAPGNALKALGYREMAAHLRGECDLAAARETMIRATIQYAKRQMTWFRKEPEVRWFDLQGPAAAAAEEIGDYVAGRIGSASSRG